MATVLDNQTPSSLSQFLEQETNKALLRFTTAGSVDDGKSTLIGRLLHDCKAVYEDQLASVRRSPVNRSGKDIDLSLLTDGLRAEREQGITIDVAYRFFSTPRRKFIIADTPGHEQYTRNMATGASTADLAIILVDATQGLLPQTRRHAYIASLLGIPNVVAAINKMDLVGYREEVFSRLREDFEALAESLKIYSVECVPISALEGDNIVGRGEKTPWYSGPTLLEYLEEVPIRGRSDSRALRFPVQTVIRPDANFRGFAGRIVGGMVRAGDEVLALPSGQLTRVEAIVTFDGNLQAARSGQSIVLQLADEIDLSRGDMLVSRAAPPVVSARFAGTVVWLHPAPLQLNRTYVAKHAGRYVKAKPLSIRFRTDINTLTEHGAHELAMNEIGTVEFETSQPLFFDAYEANREMGSLILIDPLTNATVGAVMIRESLSRHAVDRVAAGESARPTRATRPLPRSSSSLQLQETRIRRHGHRPAILTVSGDRARAEELERALLDRGFETVLVNHGETSAEAREVLYSTLWNLGVIILAWLEGPLDTQDRELFDGIASEFVFDLSTADWEQESEFSLPKALAIADTLRIASTAEWSKN